MRKQGSTNSINEKKMIAKCGMGYGLAVIRGRWKMQIFWRLAQRRIRYSELKELMPDISEKMLVIQLKELEKEDLIKRIVYPEVPPRVEYEVTENGRSLVPVLQSLSAWGDIQKERMGMNDGVCD
ncbi:transcriptional regulator, HxlR family [Chitinophaga sp. CF118]|uniref:winged helix-turn-helix transcriptional regulator n=1 Tax=Chitinophaga sp. CF118 TaxID=1884367 RepID=UPI0008E1C669|nr:winged helix-turn-helix transcriptional regulator [Chitinophaga sp. CF118]SFD76926.1 transcriptional regulator, HxlR family [Chitinophaga sp. CF118]